ncbi:toll/interleukin-1 receptor domain-containing protein [Prosthecobacter sp.]|uniref:toll/interleukin-1 receptor domain-containing protein n=1 Tax=Prosthecobacter sp. TaxID=1965333 RepID=UPI003784B097
MNTFENQIFISYASEQRPIIEGFANDFNDVRITAWWDKKLEPAEKWRKKIEEAIKNSRHLLVYCTVQSKASSEVSHEIKTFMTNAKGDLSRKIFILKAPDCPDKHVPQVLSSQQRVASLKDVIIYILKEARKELDQNFRAFEKKSEDIQKTLEKDRDDARAKVIEARNYYQHRRFWGPFAEKRDVHIFTCGRDSPPQKDRPRGTGGFRTGIDKWDYRAALGIAHFFASNYPGTKVTIEDPASKLQQEDINKVNILANRIAEIGNLLKDKDCIIIGSPDVNDFAEIVLSRIHGIEPYDDSARKKSKGFVLIRERKNTPSAFYWRKEQDETEGIARLGQSSKDALQVYGHEPPSMDGGQQKSGKMHGLLVVAQNPFSLPETRRIMILSGFSGVATNAMAKFLTEDAYLNSFFAFDDEAHAQKNRAFEAVIEVNYTEGHGSENKDARQIIEAADSITFKELVAV